MNNAAKPESLPNDEPPFLTVDLLVVGTGTGLAAALSAREQGLDVLVIEKTDLVGGSTARSGGAFWIPANPILNELGGADTEERALNYVTSVVNGTSPIEKLETFIDYGSDTVRMLSRTTRLRFTWAKGYSDYHPEQPGGSAVGRSCESAPFDTAKLGDRRSELRPGVLELPVPVPVTGGDYKWLNLITKAPLRGMRVAMQRGIQGIGGLLLGRRYVAGGQALAAGLFDGLLRSGATLWTNTALEELVHGDEGVRGAVLRRGDDRVIVRAERGVVIASGGFDHDMVRRRSEQSPALENWSLGSEGNTGDGISIAQAAGADVDLMDQAWWFPAIAPEPGGQPTVMLAERSLPGSFMVDRHGRRFVNEAEDYMSFGQHVLAREKADDPVGDMWLVFDQEYRNSYLLGGTIFPRMPLPASWYRSGIAVRASSWRELAERIGVPVNSFVATATGFNAAAAVGIDDDFGRGGSAYDRYYGDPTVVPNNNLRPLDAGHLYAVRVVLSDLGTCGGIRTDELGRALDTGGNVIDGLYAIGNAAANLFGDRYPGAGATIGQGLVYGHIAATHAARRSR
ncbi:3-ketosteroid-delta-1-dehydrogenase [Brachybacterium paraconglomeratum]|uniref:3-ketosteroid-delta-1-dehydrogenase n=1 Tax=Brachybacterium paraconglomeratum TaxID=173362 RepID=UPI0037C9B53D